MRYINQGEWITLGTLPGQPFRGEDGEPVDPAIVDIWVEWGDGSQVVFRKADLDTPSEGEFVKDVQAMIVGSGRWEMRGELGTSGRRPRGRFVVRGSRFPEEPP